MSRKIEYMDLAELQVDDRNPKSHDVDTIDASMERFGVLDPIVLDSRTGKIVSGHGRFKTLTQLQEREAEAPDGVKVSKDGTWKVPVYTGWASADDNEAAAALIAMNRTTELGGWVDEELLDLLDELSEYDDTETALAGVGFVEDDLLRLQEQVEAAEQNGAFDDVTDGIDARPSEFNSAGGWGDPSEDDGPIVELKIPMGVEERRAIISWLDSLKAEHDLELHSEVLTHLAAEGGFEVE